MPARHLKNRDLADLRADKTLFQALVYLDRAFSSLKSLSFLLTAFLSLFVKKGRRCFGLMVLDGIVLDILSAKKSSHCVHRVLTSSEGKESVERH